MRRTPDIPDSATAGWAAARAGETPVVPEVPDDAPSAARVAVLAPDAEETVRAAESPQARSIALIVIAVILVFGALYFARDFFIPVVLAFLLNLALSPVIRWLARYHVPPPAGAALVLLLGLLALAGAGYGLATPLRTWVAAAPGELSTTARRLRRVIRPVEQVTRAADQMARATEAVAPGGGAGGGTGGAARGGNGRGGPGAEPARVVLEGPSLSSRLFGTGQALAAALLEVTVLLYSLLAVGDLFLQKLMAMLPSRTDREKAIVIARTTERSISTFLMLTTMINVGEGLVVAAGMALIHMPTPFLWGTLVAAAEFIPYLGMLTMVAVLTLAGLSAFDSVAHALLAPGIYLAINFVQGNIVTPLVMSRRLTLNPVAIFLALALGWWLWGIPGVFLAVPLLSAAKICCDHVESLAAIGAFLGGRDRGERRSVLRIRVVRRAGSRPPRARGASSSSS